MNTIIDEGGVMCIISAAHYIKFHKHLTIQQCRYELFQLVHRGVKPHDYIKEYVRDRIDKLKTKDRAQFYMHEVCKRK